MLIEDAKSWFMVGISAFRFVRRGRRPELPENITDWFPLWRFGVVSDSSELIVVCAEDTLMFLSDICSTTVFSITILTILGVIPTYLAASI